MKTNVIVTHIIDNKGTYIVIRMMHPDLINTLCTKNDNNWYHQMPYKHCSKFDGMINNQIFQRV